MKRHNAVVASGFVLVALLSTSCSNDGGTAGGLAEVSPAFEQDVQKAAEDFLGHNSLRGTELEVSNDGKTDVPCDSGEAKRVYDASFVLLDRREMSSTLFGMKINSYDQDYTIIKGADQVSLTPSAELRRKDKPFTLALKIDRSAKPKMVIHAETDCLDAA
jgi:hypothetical protein